MITLALDTATDRCTVAAGDGQRVASAWVDGSRRHAAAIVGLIDRVLRELDASPGDLGRIVVADGPGSFTGLRVAAAVGKALAWRRAVEWHTAPSLLLRALGHVPAGGGAVLALSDAQRGELYAAAWQITDTAVDRLGAAPHALRPESLRGREVAVVVGTIPAALVDAVALATGRTPITGDAALPDARHLLALVGRRGGTSLVADPVRWEPDYGRPAEAQVVWERKHGHGLPAASGVAR
jgi:tRNA threonylcarbamoyladenosine biosynthesis protein TsaB